MFSRRIVCILLVAALPIAHFAIADKSDQEAARVRAVIALHFEGIKQGKVQPLQQAWNAKQGRVTYLSTQFGKDRLTSVPAQQAFKAWTAKPAPTSRGSILSIDILRGKIAVAKIRLVWQGKVYDEFLTLFKSNGAWKITGKAFIAPKTGGGYGG